MSEDQYTILRYCPPIPSQTLTLTFYLRQNVKLGEGWVGEEFPTILSCISSGPRRNMGTDPVSQSVLRNIPCGDKRGETVLFAGQVLPRPGLFKRWIVLSTGLIAIQRISIKSHLCYPVFSRLTRGVWGSLTFRACLRTWDANAILRILRSWKKKKNRCIAV